VSRKPTQIDTLMTRIREAMIRRDDDEAQEIAAAVLYGMTDTQQRKAFRTVVVYLIRQERGEI